MSVIPMNRKQKNYSMEELFMNHTDNQNQVNLRNSSKIIAINKRIDGMRTVIIAMFIAFIGVSIGFGMAIHKLKTMPVTVYQTNSNQTVDITKLPLPPLEEIEVK